MAAILMTSLLGPDAELRWANWFKLFHMTRSLFWYRSPKIVTKFTRDAHSTQTNKELLLKERIRSLWERILSLKRKKINALHYSVDFIFLSFGIMGFIVEL